VVFILFFYPLPTDSAEEVIYFDSIRMNSPDLLFLGYDITFHLVKFLFILFARGNIMARGSSPTGERVTGRRKGTLDKDKERLRQKIIEVCGDKWDPVVGMAHIAMCGEIPDNVRRPRRLSATRGSTHTKGPTITLGTTSQYWPGDKLGKP
jgi:hypothetical protein